MKPQHKKLFSLVILLILIVLTLYYGINNYSQFKELKLVNPIFIILMIPIILIGLLITGLLNIEVLKSLNLRLRLPEIFSLAVVTRFYNYITPFRGGMAARAVYLKKKYQFSYTDFLATLAGMYVITFSIAGLLGLISSWLIYNSTGNFNLIIPGIFSIVILGMLFIMFFSKYFPKFKGRWLSKISRVANGWNLIKNNPRVILSVALFSLSQLLLTALMLNLQFRVFGVEVSYFGTLILASIASLGLLISITPANLGINEAIIVFSATTLGIAPAESLAAALLGRAVQMLILFILGPIFSYKLLNYKPDENATEN